MANTHTLNAQHRTERGKGAARKLRSEGLIPAVVYGHGEETRALSVDAHELEVLFSKISVENTIINLKIAEEKAEVPALVREVQNHPVRPLVLHVDFYQIHAGVAVEVDIPLRLIGSAVGVREGGILEHVVHELPIRCLPDRIPSVLELDVSGMEMGDSLHVSDIVLPEGVEALLDPERTVCAVVAPAVVPTDEEEPEDEELAATGVGGEVGEPELIRRRAEEEEEE